MNASPDGIFYEVVNYNSGSKAFDLPDGTRYVKFAASSGSHLKIGYSEYEKFSLSDYNNDGTADLFNASYSSYNNYNTYVYNNTSTPGDISFPITPNNLGHFSETSSAIDVPNWDWNNDGKADMTPVNYGNDYVYLNTGDYKNFTQAGLTGVDFRKYPVLPDLNKDGFMDIIFITAEYGNGSVVMMLKFHKKRDPHLAAYRVLHRRLLRRQ